jgi:hypothetical protein
MIRLDGAQIVLSRIELTHTATLRRPLPARLLRDADHIVTVPAPKTTT